MLSAAIKTISRPAWISQKRMGLMLDPADRTGKGEDFLDPLLKMEELMPQYELVIAKILVNVPHTALLTKQSVRQRESRIPKSVFQECRGMTWNNAHPTVAPIKSCAISLGTMSGEVEIPRREINNREANKAERMFVVKMAAQTADPQVADLADVRVRKHAPRIAKII